MNLHHIGYIVDNIESGIAAYKPISSDHQVSKIYTIPSQKVKVCFLKMNPNILLELVEPLDGNKTLARFKKKGIAYYHLGFLVDDLDKKIIELEAANYKKISVFPSKALDGSLCAFLLSPDRQLVELIQAK